MWNLKIQQIGNITNITTTTKKKNRQTHRYGELMVTSREMGVGRGNAVVGDGAVQTLRCNKLQGCITHRKYCQYFIITINGA